MVSDSKRDHRRARPAPAAHDDDPPPSLSQVYADYSGFVWRIARRFGVPEHALEDVMHEVFLVVDRRLPSFDGRVAMTTWLYHQTRGVVANARRRDRREQRRIRLVDPQPTAAPDPEEVADRRTAAAFVERFLGTLPPDQREVFVLVEIEGMAVTDVARAQDIKVNTAYSRLRLARQRFAEATARLHRAPPARTRRRRTTA